MLKLSSETNRLEELLPRKDHVDRTAEQHRAIGRHAVKHHAIEDQVGKRHAAESMPRGERAKFNVFQKLVRQWDSLHPYNGAQIVKIKGTVDLEHCRQAWFDALELLNLGVVCISQKSYAYRCLNGEAKYHGVVRCPAGTSLEQWISDELNHPFDADGGVPFRPFVLQEEGHFWMGLCYQHWVADSASIRILIREWFVRQFDPGAPTPKALRFHAGGYLKLFGPHRDGARPTEVFLSTLRWHSKFRKARRIEDKDAFRDMRLQFRIVQSPDGLIDSLRAAARDANATVNDLFLAAIAQVCDQHVPAERRYRRQELVVASIVDLRIKAGEPLKNLFDLLLGFTSVWCPDQCLANWDSLVEHVSNQTRQQKRGGLPLASCLRMAYGIIAGKYMSREQLIEFYRKRVPLGGANSNVNLNRCWAAKYAGNPVLDYLRVAPTGPMTPLVFSTTTLGKRLSIGLTYRRAIISPQVAGTIGEGFISRLRRVVGMRE